MDRPHDEPPTAGAIENVDEEQLPLPLDHGWVKLFRRIRGHWLWPKDRKYSQLEAWEDLLLSANHAPATIAHGLRLIRVQRGQFVTSQLKLADRWRWNRETVAKFLGMLKADGMIDTETSNGYTLISILNYAKYKDKQKTKPAAKPAPNRQPNQQQPDSDASINKKEKNAKEGKKLYRRLPKSPFPTNFVISDELKTWARSNGLPSPETEFEKFKNHHLANGSVFSDWDAAPRNWLIKSKEFSTNGNGLGKSSKVTPTEGKYEKFS
jgi:biotin operon repressor